MALADRDNPATLSKDYLAMQPDWQMIDDIRAGVRAIKARGSGETYLPKNQNEGPTAYKIRLARAPWRPEFTDAQRNLCSKPFTKAVAVNEDAPAEIGGEVDPKTKRKVGGFVDDVDGRGNSLHVFAREIFVNGVADGLSAIYVTFPAAPPARTKAEEKASGVRPYWVGIKAPDIIDLKTRLVNGREVVEHIRIKECTTERDGFAEITVERIRQIELDEQGRPMSQTWRKPEDGGAYVIERPFEFLTGVTEIPIALLFTGERSGNYRVKPPLLDLAVMQIELYNALSRVDQIKNYAGFPMLKGKGIKRPQPTPITDADGRQTGEKPAAQIEVGPNVTLFTEADGQVGDGIQRDWDFIQPAADNMRVLGEDIKSLTEDFRRLALQPTTSNSGNLTATGAAIEGAKSHSAIEVWANALKATLDQALKYTAEWLKLPDTVTADVHTDFGVDTKGADRLRLLLDAVKAKELSGQTFREECARDGTLGPNWSEDEEEKRLAEEAEALEPEQPIDPRTGQPIDPNALPPTPVPPGDPTGQQQQAA